MNFFTFKVRNPNYQQLTPEEQEIGQLVHSIKGQTISFQEQWIAKLLELFGTKQEMHLFWTFFSQIILIQPLNQLSQNGTMNKEEINFQNAILSRLTNPSETIQPTMVNPQYQTKTSTGESIVRQVNYPLISSESINKPYYTNQSLNSQSIDQMNINLQDLQLQDYEINNNNWNGQYSVANSNGSNEQVSKKRDTPKQNKLKSIGIIPNYILNQIKQQFLYYQSVRKQIININQMAKKYNITPISLGRLIKKWSIDDPKLADYLSRVQEQHSFPPQKRQAQNMVTEWSRSIRQLVKLNPYIGVHQIKQRLKMRNFSIIPQQRTIKHILSNMKFMKTKVGIPEDNKNTAKNALIRRKYCEVYLGMLRKPQIKIFFVDCCKYDTNLTPDFKWTLPGQAPPTANENFNVTLYICLPIQGYFYWKSQLKMGGQNVYKEDSLELLFKQVAKQNKNEQMIFILNCINELNNYSVKEMISNFQWKSLVLPPKSSELNPVNSIFTQMKRQLRMVSKNIKNLTQLQENIKLICPTLKHFKPNFQQVKKNVQIGLQNGKI